MVLVWQGLRFLRNLRSLTCARHREPTHRGHGGNEDADGVGIVRAYAVPEVHVNCFSKSYLISFPFLTYFYSRRYPNLFVYCIEPVLQQSGGH